MKSATDEEQVTVRLQPAGRAGSPEPGNALPAYSTVPVTKSKTGGYPAVPLFLLSLPGALRASPDLPYVIGYGSQRFRPDNVDVARQTTPLFSLVARQGSIPQLSVPLTWLGPSLPVVPRGLGQIHGLQAPVQAVAGSMFFDQLHLLIHRQSSGKKFSRRASSTSFNRIVFGMAPPYCGSWAACLSCHSGHNPVR